MKRIIKTTVLAAVLLVAASLFAAPAFADRFIGCKPLSPQERENLAFDPAESAGLFVGVSEFYTGDKPTKGIFEIPYAVDDAVDLAHVFAVELQLVNPKKVTLALSGTPQKPESRTRLDALKKAGVKVIGAGLTNILAQLTLVSSAAGKNGLAVISFATHGYMKDGDWLLARDSLPKRLLRTGIPVAIILEELADSDAPRKLLFLDACRERMSGEKRGERDPKTAMSKSFLKAITEAKGMVTMTGTTAGGYSYDDDKKKNGVFTSCIVEGLRGEAPADKRGFVTPETLAVYVDKQVKSWVKRNRPEDKDVSCGIGYNTDNMQSREMPLAANPEAQEMVKKDLARRTRLKDVLRDNTDYKIITGQMAQEIAETLDKADKESVEPLLNRLERLEQGGSEYANDFSLWWKYIGRKISAPPTREPVARPTREPVARPTRESAPPPSPSDEIRVPPMSSVGKNPPKIEFSVKPAASVNRLDAKSGLKFRFKSETSVGIARYEYRLDNQPIKKTKRIGLSFYDLPAGKHTLQIQAVDLLGNKSEPAVHVFTVRGNERPTVKFLSPSKPGAKIRGETLNVKLKGTDEDGRIVKFKCAIGHPNNAKVSADGKFEFEVADGNQKLYAQAEDDAGGLSDWEELDIYYDYTDISIGPVIGEPYTEPITDMKFVWVSPGTFKMGFNNISKDERPVHDVTLTQGFWMGKFEVTQGQWEQIMGSNPSLFKKGDDYPVEKVSWNDAQDFIRKLNDRSDDGGFRLPTEAEWEYACRSGDKNEKYSGWNNVDAVAWYDNNSGRTTHPVGTKAANGLGICDMIGNVWEWCNDWYGKKYYKKSPRVNPKGPSSGKCRMLRGGSYNNTVRFCRSPARRWDLPTYGHDYLGLRLVRVLRTQ